MTGAGGSSDDEKVTYVTLSADHPRVVAGFAAAIPHVKNQLGRKHPFYVAGVPRETGTTTRSLSPADTRLVVSEVANATRNDVNDALEAARTAFPEWARTPWRERAAILARAAAGFRRRNFELATFMIHEMGKNRLEALGEIEETADLIDYYVAQMEAHDGYVAPMASLHPRDRNTSVLRPYGVWAVISPWNFPVALLAAPIASALLTGNTVVAKPSSETPLCGILSAEIFIEAGLPPGTFSLLTGPGGDIGEALIGSAAVDGLTFTGSYDVGFRRLYQRFATVYPRPCIVEMGGKNPAIVMDSADLDRAVSGVFRSAFGMNGHKCSACSRVYVHRAVYDEFLARLVQTTRNAVIGDPLAHGVFAGPLATKNSAADYARFVAEARSAATIQQGGAALTEGDQAHGFFAMPTIVTGLPEEHPLVKEELFVPILHVAKIDTLDEALHKANDTVFGLTAGLFSQRQDEIDRFLDRIAAGVVYVNRAAGATTGAWPGVQPFGGWKASGSTGKNIGGLYTLPCYLREQSRTVTS